MSLPNRSTGASFDALGKIDNQNLPPSDDRTDWSNPSLARAICDVAALGLVSQRIWLRMTLSSTTGGLVLNNWFANWSNITTIVPTLSRTSTGLFIITLPTSVSDEYDASFNILNNISVNLSAATANLEGATPGFLNASASGNIITIHTFDATGTLSDLTGKTIFIQGF